MNPELKQSLTTVTPLSKYLAMALFIALPFAGLFVGYQFAPEKVVERVVIKEVSVDYVLEEQAASGSDLEQKVIWHSDSAASDSSITSVASCDPHMISDQRFEQEDFPISFPLLLGYEGSWLGSGGKSGFVQRCKSFSEKLAPLLIYEPHIFIPVDCADPGYDNDIGELHDDPNRLSCANDGVKILYHYDEGFAAAHVQAYVERVSTTLLKNVKIDNGEQYWFESESEYLVVVRQVGTERYYEFSFHKDNYSLTFVQKYMDLVIVK